MDVQYVHLKAFDKQTLPIGTFALKKADGFKIVIAGAVCSDSDQFRYSAGRDKAKGQLFAEKDPHRAELTLDELRSIDLPNLLNEMKLWTRRMESMRESLMHEEAKRALIGVAERMYEVRERSDV